MDEWLDIVKAAGSEKSVKAGIKETTQVTVKDNMEKTETVVKSEEITHPMKTYISTPGYLTVKFSSNVNLGNFQSAKVEKGLMIPIGVEADPLLEEKIKATDKWASDLAKNLMHKELELIRNRK